MKNLYLSILIILSVPFSIIKAEKDVSHDYSSKMMTDTVTLTVEGGEARIGDQICVSIIGKNFTDIIAFQWQIQFDPSLLSYSGIQVNPSITMLSMNESEASSGILKMVYLDVENPITIDSLPIMELCFDVIGISEDLTYVNIVSGEGIPVEIVKSGNPDQPVLSNLISEGISIINTIDCGLILYCPGSLEYTFDSGMVIRKEDFIESYDLFLTCFGYKDEEVKLINMSAPGARPMDSLIMTCDNVFHTTSIGAVVEAYSSRTENGMTFIDTVSFLLCQAPVTFNIPDDLEDCINSTRSCIDPLQCAAIDITVTEPLTVVPYEVLLDSSDYASCDRILFSQFEEDTAIPDPYPVGFALDCNQYVSDLDVIMGIEADLSDQYIFLAPEWCTSLITLSGFEEICPIDTNAVVDIPVTVRSDVSNVHLNGQPLGRVDTRLYTMSNTDLNDQNNVITVNDGKVGSLNGISTLDVVLIYQFLINEDPGPIESIASDVDLSGSLTTKDFGIVRYNILGIQVDSSIGRSFIVEKNESFEGFDFLDFENDYSRYVFDRSALNEEEGLEFEVFFYGDINGNTSDFHKSISKDRVSEVFTAEQWLEKHEEVRIPLQFFSTYEDPIVALDLGLHLKGLELSRIESNYLGSELLHHEPTDQQLNLSFFQPENIDDVQLTLVMQAQRGGLLSEMLIINDKAINEVVTEDLSVSAPKLIFTEDLTTSNQISVYPNPAYESINIILPESKMGSTINIYSSIGQLLKSEVVRSTEHHFDTDELNAHGLLQLVIVNGDEISSFKIVTHR